MWKQKPTIECQYCSEIEWEHVDTLIGKDARTLEYRCNSCHQLGFFDEKKEKDTINCAALLIEKLMEENDSIKRDLGFVEYERDMLMEVVMALEDWDHQTWDPFGGLKNIVAAKESTWQALREYKEWERE